MKLTSKIAVLGLIPLAIYGCSNGNFASSPGSSNVTTKPSTTTTVPPTTTTTAAPTVKPEEPNQLSTSEGQICGDNIAGFGGKVYNIPKNSAALPDLTKLTPVGQTNAAGLNVAERDFRNGFPNLPGLLEWFAVRFYGEFQVETGGTYQFKTTSDDGSKLYIDDKLNVNNDGIHGPSTAVGQPIELAKGFHKIVVEWYQGPAFTIALQVYWKTPTESWKIIPASAVTNGPLCNLNNLGKF